MAASNLVHSNEYGLPLNAIEWLETHHNSKAQERGQMFRDLHLRPGSLVVDAGCGPGLWTPLLAKAIGPAGRIIGVDISAEARVTAQQRSQEKPYHRQVQYKRAPMEQLPLPRGSANVIFSANVSQYLPDPSTTFAAIGQYLKCAGDFGIEEIVFGTIRVHQICTNRQAHDCHVHER